MRARNADGPLAVHAPLALFPSPYPRECYDLALQLQPHFNNLVDRIARDSAFLDQVMARLEGVDEFTWRLFGIYRRVRANPSAQPVWMGFHRSDYMLHKPTSDSPGVLQQVEINTISSAFPSLSTRVSELHAHLSDRTQFFNASSSSTPDIHRSALPANNPLAGIAKALGTAWTLYGAPSSVVLMVVQPGEHNVYDQRWIEYKLFDTFGAKLIRKTLAEIAAEAKHVGDSRKLFIGETEIAVVYFRSGYAPGDHPTESEWTARLVIEESYAVKCPPVAYQLAGTKKMQQVIAAPGVLEKFVDSPEIAALLRSSFTGLYPLDESAEGVAAYERALESPRNFVMKPQREGGGNNVYGDEIRAKLLELSPEERKAFILMDVIQPPPFKNALVRRGSVVTADVVSELGIYGAYVTDGATVHVNEAAGHLLRTKTSDSNEGGVAAGFAVLDSPFLV
ncbi:Glutathione synthetase [Polyrhizophydium stewartii]|uniref:Glutathione synthetase n=1 Tax=Polyrhizophydium stewartii TaxID=2732419 RepID=A0ABR4NH20_9FUNG